MFQIFKKQRHDMYFYHQLKIKFKKVFSLLSKCYQNTKGAVLLEIALILPTLIILIMGILEFSLIFSLRAGVEEVSRAVTRIQLSSTGGNAYAERNNLGGQAIDRVITDLMVERMQAIAFMPNDGKQTNINICSSNFRTASQLANSTPATGNCINFNRDTNTVPVINLGAEGDYVRVDINYRHDFLTPLGSLIQNLGPFVNFSSTTYFRKED